MFPTATQHPLVVALQQHPFGSAAWLAAAEALLEAKEPGLGDWQEEVKVLVERLKQG